MSILQENGMQTSLEHKFARDLIRFVLHEHMTGLRWIPNGMFKERDLDTPFTPQFERAVRDELDYEGHNMHILFDTLFPDKSLIEDNYSEICMKSMDRFVSKAFCNEDFINYSACMAMFAGLSYHYGVAFAPYASYLVLVETVIELKKIGKVDDTYWEKMQNWLENRKESIRLGTCVISRLKKKEDNRKTTVIRP